MSSAPKLIVLAGAWDDAARDFVARHERSGVSLMVPRDLSRRGWHFRPADPAATVAVTGTERFRLGEASGLLTRLPAVTVADLPHIVAGDRAYVAAELTAFLLALLECADLRVVNRPTPLCLCGPAWHEAKWRRAARELGFAAEDVRRSVALGAVSAEDERGGTKATVVGEVCIGASSLAHSAAVRAMAVAAGAELLTVEFDNPGPAGAVLRARPVVDLGDPLVEAAVLGLFGIDDTQGARTQ